MGTTEDINGGTTGTLPEPEMIVLFGGVEDYTILRTDNTTGFGTVVQEFLSKLRTKIGKDDIFAISNYGNVSEKEILLGSISQRTESVDQMKDLPKEAYKIAFSGQRLVVSAHTPELLAEALDCLLNAICQTADGAWGIAKDFSAFVDFGDSQISIPEFESATAISVGTYISNTNQSQQAYTGISESDYAAYNQKLLAAGFALYSQNEIVGNKFATYISDTTEVHLIWFSSIGNFRIVYAKKGWLPSTNAPQYEKVKDSTVTQLARTGTTQNAPGQSYVVQLEDGSFVIIDGGPKDASDAENLKKFLQENKPATHAKPKVVWMFTHLHSDHTQLAIDFLASNLYNIELSAVCYNFPNVETALKEESCKIAYLTIQSLCTSSPNTNVYIFHSGQKWRLAGCEIEFLYTQEDHWPNVFETANDTSAVWRMTFSGGHDFMVLGDSESSPCTQIEKIYGTYLKSDVLQPSHHGFNGATMKIYEAIDPTVCLWPVDEERFYNDTRCLGTKTGYEFNYFLRNREGIQNYHAGKTVTVKMSDLTVVE